MKKKKKIKIKNGEKKFVQEGAKYDIKKSISHFLHKH